MSVEKMMMVNIIGRIDETDRICKTVIALGSLHAVSAMEEMNTADFTMRISEENREALMGVSYMKPFVSDRNFNEVREKMDRIRLMCCGSQELEKTDDAELILDYGELVSRIEGVLGGFGPVIDEFNMKKESEAKYRADLESFELLQELDIPAQKLFSMKNFSFSLLRVSAENAVKLNHNKENIPAILISVKKSSDHEMVAALVPSVFEAEAERIFKALNCEEVALEKGYTGTPAEIVRFIKAQLDSLEREIGLLKGRMEELSGKHRKEISLLVRSAELEKKCGTLKNEIASAEDYFYLYGWIPKGEEGRFENSMKAFGEKAIVIMIGADEVNTRMVPPTKLRNNRLFRPFETMVAFTEYLHTTR